MDMLLNIGRFWCRYRIIFVPIFNFILDYFLKLVAGDRIPSHLEIKRCVLQETLPWKPVAGLL